MNKSRRERIETICKDIDNVYKTIEFIFSDITDVQWEEGKYMENLPEYKHKHKTDRLEKCEQACRNLGSAASSIAWIANCLESALDSLEQVTK